MFASNIEQKILKTTTLRILISWFDKYSYVMRLEEICSCIFQLSAKYTLASFLLGLSTDEI